MKLLTSIMFYLTLWHIIITFLTFLSKPPSTFSKFCVCICCISFIYNILFITCIYQGYFLFQEHNLKEYKILNETDASEITFFLPGGAIGKHINLSKETKNKLQTQNVYEINYYYNLKYLHEKYISQNIVKIIDNILQREKNKNITVINIYAESLGCTHAFYILEYINTMQKYNINKLVFMTPYTNLRDIVTYKASIIFSSLLYVLHPLFFKNYYDCLPSIKKLKKSDLNINLIIVKTALNDSIIPYSIQSKFVTILRNSSICKNIMVERKHCDHYGFFF